MIEISHLTKRYGDHVAVSDLSLNIESGKIYGFLGPNGAGKSTTMNIITGYIAATEGTVKIDGFDILKQPEEARKCVGYLPELPPLYVDMTVEEYLKFVADLKKIPKREKRQSIDEVMELTKIADVKNRLIRNLSKGYRQRTGFAQAVLGYPKVIILDEPTVGLDPKQIIEIRELVQSLGKNHTVILSSHILSEVREVCEHIFILSRGRLVASDTTEHLIHKMSGGQEVSLLLKGKKDAADNVLKQAGVGQYVFADNSEPGCCRVVLKAQEQADIREKVFYAFANAKIPILEMKDSGKSLEEVFLELTNQDAAKLGIELDAETDTETGVETESNTEAVAEVESGTEAAAEVESNTEAVAEIEADVESNTKADTEVEIEADVKANTETDIDAKAAEEGKGAE